MNEMELLDIWRFEEDFPFTGWDFSHLEGRWDEESVPWDYDSIVRGALRDDMELLDMDTGGGEYLLSLRHPNGKTHATESYPPNVELCRKRLSPLGIAVAQLSADIEPLPFEDASLDIIINRHGAYMTQELYRCLKPGGLFITEQVGCRNNMQLSRRLLPGYAPDLPQHDLMHECSRFDAEGFEIVECKEAFPRTKFFDIGALVYLAKIIEWEFPGFSVKRCARELLALEEELCERGYICSLNHLFMIVAKKPGETELKAV